MTSTKFSHSRIKRGLPAATLAVALLLTGLPLFIFGGGQDPTSSQNKQDLTGPTVQGVVSDISGTTIKLLNGLVTVQAGTAAVVSEQNQTPMNLSNIKIGTVITVLGNQGVGVFVANVIQVHGPKFDGKVQGMIDSVDLTKNQFSVLGISIALDPSTVFEGNNGLPFGPIDLAAGKIVDVEVAVFQNNLVATRISLDGGDVNSQSNN